MNEYKSAGLAARTHHPTKAATLTSQLDRVLV
jgi:hypothetical protein